MWQKVNLICSDKCNKYTDETLDISQIYMQVGYLIVK